MTAIRIRIASLIYCVVLALAPLPFGSVDEITIAVWAMLLGAVGVLAIPLRPTNAQLVFYFFASIAALAWGLVLHEQTSSHPWLASDLVDPIWAQASGLLDLPLPKYVTVVRNQPFFSAGPQMVAFLSLLGGFLLGGDRARAKAIFRTVAWSGAIYAAYGILSFIWDPSMLLWRDKLAYTTVLTGTFINRNTAAIYFGACAVLWLLLFFRVVFGPSMRIANDTLLASLILQDLPRRAMVCLAMFIMLMSATFMTGSRAGSLLFSLTCAGLSFICLRKRHSSRKTLLVLIVGLVLAGVILFEIVGGGVDARISSDALANEARFPVYRAVLRLIFDHPWLGTGLGTFAWIFPRYRPSDISAWGVWDRAHSTPMEIASEQGVPFALLVLCTFLIIFSTLIYGSTKRNSGKIYPLAGLLIGLLAAVHSLVDFSLQVPGLAIVVFCVLGVGLAQTFADRNGWRRISFQNHQHITAASS